ATNQYLFIGDSGVSTDGSGVCFMKNRGYSSSSGSFLQRDPLRWSGSGGLYTYCLNNPVSYIDPSGLMLTDAQKRDPAYWLSAAVHGNWYGKYNSGGNRETAPGTIGDLSVGYVDLADRAAKAHDILVYMGVPGAQKIVSKWMEGIVGNGYSFANKDEERYVNGFLNAAGEGGQGAGILDSGLVPSHWKSLPAAEVANLLNALRDTLGSDSSQFQQVVRITQSQDPNDKLCPAGYGTSGFIRANSLMPYMIRFENGTNATAPAQQVSVVDPLSTNLDWTSFELTEIGFGDHIISVPAHSQYFETTVPMSYNGVDFEVDVYAGIDLTTGKVYSDFYSIDPLTSLPPDVMTGFLPPPKTARVAAKGISPSRFDRKRILRLVRSFATWPTLPSTIRR
ncbi:MAG: hypothetical protein NT154_20015, partial [Verrucomicrobia bacterium]|nr:hypothetical protein [Verrucomicrobiota bacterium]